MKKLACLVLLVGCTDNEGLGFEGTQSLAITLKSPADPGSPDVRLPDSPTMLVNRERIELPLAGRPVEVNDSYPIGLVMRIDVRGEGPAKTLSVKLRRDHDAVVGLAKGAVARQEADGVHLFVPKTLGGVATAPVPSTATATATNGPTASAATTAAPIANPAIAKLIKKIQEDES